MEQGPQTDFTEFRIVSEVISEPSTTKAAVIMAWTCSCHDRTTERNPFFGSVHVLANVSCNFQKSPVLVAHAFLVILILLSYNLILHPLSGKVQLLPSLPFPSSNALRHCAACPKFSWRTPASPSNRKAIPTPGAQS